MNMPDKRNRLIHRKERIMAKIFRCEKIKNESTLSQYGWYDYGFFRGILAEIEDQIDIIDEESEPEKGKFCKFSLDGEDINVNIQGMNLEQIARVVGASLNDYLTQIMKGKTYGESKKETLDLCQSFCDAMRIDTQDLNPWCPVSKIPHSNQYWNPPILISDDIGEHMCVGYYDDREHAYRCSDGEVFEDAVWWKRIQDLPKPLAFYNKIITEKE